MPKLIQNQAQFDLIYFDPYQSDLYEPVLEAIAQLMTSESAIAVEHSRDKILPEVFNNLDHKLEMCDRRTYGQIGLSFYQKSNLH
jgi:16S rRNA (guanine966-N2)-methyltransferase